MTEQIFPKATERQIEDERKDAVWYKNPYMYDLCELAALGLIVKNLGTDNVLELVENLNKMIQVQKDRESQKPKERQV